MTLYKKQKMIFLTRYFVLEHAELCKNERTNLQLHSCIGQKVKTMRKLQHSL